MSKGLILALLILPTLASAQGYVTLVGLPGVDTTTGGSNFNSFVNSLYALSIGIAALLAVIKIIIAGVKYMLTDIVTSKGAAKKDIQGALIGLLIVLGAVLVLTIINPQLTQVAFDPERLETPEFQQGVNTPSLVDTMGPNDRLLPVTTGALTSVPDTVPEGEEAQWACENTLSEACAVGGEGQRSSQVIQGQSEVFCYVGEWDDDKEACLIRSSDLPVYNQWGEGESQSGSGGTWSGLPSSVTISVRDPIDFFNLGSQTLIPLGKTEVVAFPFRTTGSTDYLGKFSIASVTGNSGVQREVWISTSPGGEPLNTDMCLRRGTSSTVIDWSQTDDWRCSLNNNQDYFLNVRNTNCPEDSCDVYRNIFTEGNP
jgi:hypothetical protein